MQISQMRTSADKIPQPRVKEEPGVMVKTPFLSKKKTKPPQKRNYTPAVVYVAVVASWLPV